MAKKLLNATWINEQEKARWPLQMQQRNNETTQEIIWMIQRDMWCLCARYYFFFNLFLAHRVVEALLLDPHPTLAVTSLTFHSVFLQAFFTLPGGELIFDWKIIHTAKYNPEKKFVCCVFFFPSFVFKKKNVSSSHWSLNSSAFLQCKFYLCRCIIRVVVFKWFRQYVSEWTQC